MKPVHASPFEHQASPLGEVKKLMTFKEFDTCQWENGVTHMDREYNYWSGNFRGWTQYRQLI